ANPGLGGDVVTDICERAGLAASQIDVSLLTNSNINNSQQASTGGTYGAVTVQGFLCQRPTPAASLLKTLMQAYFFDACESSGKMRFIPRGMAPALAIPESDLGLRGDHRELTESFAQAHDLPVQYTITYDDPSLNYQEGKQLWRRNSRIIRTKQQALLDIRMT